MKKLIFALLLFIPSMINAQSTSLQNQFLNKDGSLKQSTIKQINQYICQNMWNADSSTIFDGEEVHLTVIHHTKPKELEETYGIQVIPCDGCGNEELNHPFLFKDFDGDGETDFAVPVWRQNSNYMHQRFLVIFYCKNNKVISKELKAINNPTKF